MANETIKIGGEFLKEVFDFEDGQILIRRAKSLENKTLAEVIQKNFLEGKDKKWNINTFRRPNYAKWDDYVAFYYKENKTRKKKEFRGKFPLAKLCVWVDSNPPAIISGFYIERGYIEKGSEKGERLKSFWDWNKFWRKFTGDLQFQKEVEKLVKEKNFIIGADKGEENGEEWTNSNFNIKTIIQTIEKWPDDKWCNFVIGKRIEKDEIKGDGTKVLKHIAKTFEEVKYILNESMDAKVLGNIVKKDVKIEKIIIASLEEKTKQFEEEAAKSEFLPKAKLIERVKKSKPLLAKREIMRGVYYHRNPDIAALVRMDTSGVCDLCGKEAPFKNHENKPYLECHHIKHLAENGKDEVKNCVALCPNCHAKMHVLNLESDRKRLFKTAQKRHERLFLKLE